MQIKLTVAVYFIHKISMDNLQCSANRDNNRRYSRRLYYPHGYIITVFSTGVGVCEFIVTVQGRVFISYHTTAPHYNNNLV